MNRYETIYSYFINYPKEEVDKAINKLSQEEKELLRLRFSNNWDNKYKRSFYYIISKIKVILKSKENVNYSNGKKVTTIYQILNSYSKEDIDYIISLLPSKDKYILYLRYGTNLSNPDTSNWNNYDKRKIASVIQKIRKQLENKINCKEVLIRQEGILTIYQIFREYSKSEIDKVLDNLSYEDKRLLYLRYGSNLEKIDTSNWKREYINKFYGYLLPKIRSRLKSNYIKENKKIEIDKDNTSILNKKVSEIEYLLDKENNVLLDKFKKEEILIYILVTKMDNSYTLDDLEKFFKIDKKYLLKIAKDILNETITFKCLVKR